MIRHALTGIWLFFWMLPLVIAFFLYAEGGGITTLIVLVTIAMVIRTVLGVTFEFFYGVGHGAMKAIRDHVQPSRTTPENDEED